MCPKWRLPVWIKRRKNKGGLLFFGDADMIFLLNSESEISREKGGSSFEKEKSERCQTEEPPDDCGFSD